METPSNKLIKFVCISDTHTKTKDLKLPSGDVLIHAGDFTFSGKRSEILNFNEFLKNLDFKYKIVIAGNHDLSFDEEYHLKRKVIHTEDTCTPSEAKKILKNVIYLENSSVELFGYKIWGSPVTPRYFNWAFMKERGVEIKKVWDLIPNDIDILITHGPPYQILDITKYNESVGCKELAEQVLQRIKPKYHIFGHIHESNGTCKINETNFINAAICNVRYMPKNNFYKFELEDKSI